MASFFHAYCPEGVNSKYRLIVFDDMKEAFIPLTGVPPTKRGKRTLRKNKVSIA